MLRFVGITTTGTVGFDSGIGDLTLKTLNGSNYLYAATGVGGGITAWRVQNDGTLVRHDDQTFAATISSQVARKLMPVTLAGTTYLALDVDTATGLVSYDLSANGQIGSLRTTGTLSGGGDIDALVQYSVGDTSYLAIAHDDTDQIVTYRVNGDGSLSRTGSQSGQAIEMEVLQVEGLSFVVTADTTTNSVQAYEVNTTTGTLSAPKENGAAQGLGINTPTALEVVEAYGSSWVIVAGSESNSISVLQLGVDGRLVPTDHILDTLSTRFERVQDLKVVTAGDQVFVLAGGGDDGLSLFTLTPDGKLVHLDSFADTLQSGLQNVQALEMVYAGGALHIYATSQEDAGITQMTVSLANLGQVIQGTGTLTGTAGDDMLSGGSGNATLSGGAGNDILIAATGTTTMTGGAGQDIFVMRAGSGETVITDFQAGTDRLDLFDFPLLRNPGQLTVTSTGQGAEVRYLNNTISIRSANGSSLDSNDLFGSGFTGPDHVPVSSASSGGGGSGGSGSGGGGTSSGSAGVVGRISVNSETANAGLSDAEIRFTPTGGTAVTARADAQGQFDLTLPAGTTSGQLDIVKSYATASGEITALDALQVLRIAVGMNPTWGAARPENLIAADINRDGGITALDALEVLRAAVGMQSSNAPEWVFLDANADLSGITPTSVTYQTGAAVTASNGTFGVDMTSILLGNMEAYT